VDITSSVSCSKNLNKENQVTLCLGNSEIHISFLLKKILLQAYSEKYLKHKVNDLISKMDVLG
jgi:hypothetical protein